MSPDLTKLRDLLVGSVIDAIDPPDKGVQEAVCKFTVRKGARKHEFHLHATDLGWWIGEHESAATGPDGNESRVYEDFSDMSESMSNHMCSEAVDDRDPDEPLFRGIADIKGRRVGFRCLLTGREWWVSLSTGKGLTGRPHIQKLLLTLEGRDQLADFFGTHLRWPMSKEVSP